MPPVRWKLHIQVTLLIVFITFTSSDLLQDSGTVDGWRPIIGKSHRDVEDAITIYRNPSQIDSESKPVKAETIAHHTPSPTLSTKPYQTISTSEAIAAALISSNTNNKHGKKIHGSKPAPVLKIQQPIVLIPKFNNHGHGPHIPLSSGSQRRHPAIAHNNYKGKRPSNAVRGSPSLKNEIFIPASSTTSGSFAIFNQPHGPHGPHRLREGQNLPGGKHFHLVSHQFGNHFGLGGNQGNNDVVIQQVPVRTLLIQNQHSNQNEPNAFIKSDDFNKNLVPPPYSYIQQNNAKPTDFPQNELGEFTEKATYHNTKVVGNNKYKDRRVAHPESLISYVPSHFEDKHKFNFHGNDESDVQITKEKIKSLHNNIPISYQSNEEENAPYHFQHNGKPNENVRTHHVAESYSSISNYNHEPKHKNKNQVRESFVHYEEPKDDRYKKPISIAPSNPTYEVTEGKHWQNYQPFLSTRPTLYKPLYSQLTPTVQEQAGEQGFQQHSFLPTPYHPENTVQNSAPLDDISSIYSELNKKKVNQHQEYVSEQPEYFNFKEETDVNKFKPFKNEEYATEQPDYFNLREVSTHYPIITKSEYPTVTSIPDGIQSTEYVHEQTTLRSNSERLRPVQNYQSEEEVEATKPPAVRKPQDYRSRKPIRRRKPQSNRSTAASTTTTSTTTTEEIPTETASFDLNKAELSNENYSNDLQKIKRTRKPGRVRTTQAPILETTPKFEHTTKLTQIIKQKHKNKFENAKPIKITETLEIEEELPSNHRNPEDTYYSERVTPSVHTYQDDNDNNNNYRYQSTTEDYPITFESELINPKLKPDNSIETEDYFKVAPTSNRVPEETQDFNSKYIVETPQTYTDNYEIQERPTQKRKRIRQPTTSTTTEEQPVIYTLTPENELDFVYSTHTNQFESAKDFTSTQEIPTKLISNHRNKPTILTTTAAPPQSTSSATTITTPKSTETSTKVNRGRGRPTTGKYDNKNRPRFSVKEYRDRLNQYSSTSSTESSKISSTEATRLRFPNRSRKTSTTLQDDEPTTEKTKFTPKEPRYNGETTPLDKKISTRVRLSSNRRSTTEASTTLRVSIKPNIFSNLKRPSPLTLKTRIQNKFNRTNNEEKVTEKPTTFDASTDNTIPIDLATEPSIRQVSLSEKHDVDITNDDDEDEAEETENDVLLLSQRISNLTSSAQNEYDTPGLFKAVSPNSRIVPSYFTISTDDPILPLEAFFPSIKERMNKNDDN